MDIRMRVDGRPTRTIWLEPDHESVGIIDQTRLPHAFATCRLASLADAANAISTMQVRGAPLIGATAAYGMWLAMRDDPSDEGVARARSCLLATRPTAVNLRWALDCVAASLARCPEQGRADAALACAGQIVEEDVTINRCIGEAALPLISRIAERRDGGPVNVLTHCNAGWLATVDWGTATAPIYMAHDAGIAVHVWVDETRPRNQGAGLTAWELANHGVPHTVIVDSAAGHYMSRGEVDLVLTGVDRATATGDICNKIGTYQKALAAKDTGVPFYAALPSPTIDWTIRDAMTEIPIEERGAEEVTRLTGRLDDGTVATISITPPGTRAANPAFDVTPARLLAGLVTERGIAQASEQGLLALFPERQNTGDQEGTT